jgi:hypothetical protein
MPYRLSEWRGRIQKAAGEYRVAKEALDRLNAQVAADANTLHSSLSEHLRQADLNLEGTYIIRDFAVFDATLRSYDRYHFNDQDRETNAATMLDQLGALLHVPEPIRAGVHRARRVRNCWAHELEENPGPMTLDRVRGYLQTYLDRFPKTWP